MQVLPLDKTQPAATPAVRPPWPDELPRLRHYLPEAFLLEDKPVLFVGVSGSAERLVAAGALVLRSAPAGDDIAAALLYLRVEDGERQAAWINAQAGAAVACARRRGVRRIYAGQTFDKDSPVATALRAAGFSPERRSWSPAPPGWSRCAAARTPPPQPRPGWHRSTGVFALSGPGLRRDELIHGAGLLDITPTVLALFGLPAGTDMDGRVLVEAFTAPPILQTVPSWEPTPENERHPLFTWERPCS